MAAEIEIGAPRLQPIGDTTLESLLFGCPANPLPYVAMFTGPVTALAAPEVRWYATWVEGQDVCSKILAQHGDEVMLDMMEWLVKACIHHRVHMPPRLQGIAATLGLEVL